MKEIGVGYATHPMWLVYTLKLEVIFSPHKMELTHRLQSVINWNNKI
jgi:hypothetical protein